MQITARLEKCMMQTSCFIGLNIVVSHPRTIHFQSVITRQIQHIPRVNILQNSARTVDISGSTVPYNYRLKQSAYLCSPFHRVFFKLHYCMVERAQTCLHSQVIVIANGHALSHRYFIEDTQSGIYMSVRDILRVTLLFLQSKASSEFQFMQQSLRGQGSTITSLVPLFLLHRGIDHYFNCIQ